jgi:hypothetical protein
MGAWVCLSAVVLLWAPMWASAWATSGLTCCPGNMCAAHGQGKAKVPETSRAAKQEERMECGHSQSAGIAACTMSRCHDQASSLVGSTVYVLPTPAVSALPAKTLRAAASVKYEEILQIFAPPSPPPRGSLP